MTDATHGPAPGATHDAYIFGEHELPADLVLPPIIAVGDAIVVNRRGRKSVKVLTREQFDADYEFIDAEHMGSGNG